MSVIAADLVRPSIGGTTRSLVRGTAASWANLDGTGTIALRDSENVSSVVDNGTGDYTFNLSNAAANVNYVSHLSTEQALSFFYLVSGRTVSAVRSGSANLGGSPTDSDNINFSIHGDLA